MQRFLKTEDLAEKLILALDHFFGNVFITDGRGQIIYFNQSSAESMGCTTEELLGMTSEGLEADSLVSESVTLAVLKSKRSVIKRITYLRTGTVSNVGCVPIFNDAGELVMTAAYSIVDKDLDNFMRTLEEETRVTKQALSYIEATISAKTPIVAESKSTRETFGYAAKAAVSDTTILLNGESGTGKEVLAHFIHRSSNRASGTFIPVNCSAIPRELLEAEFFGYVRGAFTGANNDGRAGVFELADHGTLFLDEIGDMPLALQPKLLRVLESGEFSRLGSSKTIHVDVRLITATNRDLAKMVRTGAFREDLYYRLNVIPIHIVPLRKRPEDLLALAEMFLGVYNKKHRTDKYISEELRNAFLSYDWPGNIRELRNLMERLVIVSPDDRLRLPRKYLESVAEEALPDSNYGIAADIPAEGTLKEQVRAFERSRIRNLLSQNGNNVPEAAKRLGISRSGLYQKLSEE